MVRKGMVQPQPRSGVLKGIMREAVVGLALAGAEDERGQAHFLKGEEGLLQPSKLPEGPLWTLPVQSAAGTMLKPAFGNKPASCALHQTWSLTASMTSTSCS